MKFTKEQQRIAYKKLPEDVRNFIFSNEVNDLVDEIKKEIGLTEEQSIIADAEILYSLIGLQNLNISIEAIAKASNKQSQDLIRMSQKLQKDIFDKIKAMGINLEEFVLSNKSKQIDLNSQNKTTPENISKTTTVEIPPANLPMIEPGEVVHDTKPPITPPIVETRSAIPPQPTIKPSTSTPPKPVNSHYPNGQDPYREPLQ